jgi:hypothetical protein
MNHYGLPLRLVLLATLVALATAHAAQQSSRPAAGGVLPERFNQWDPNGDGKISREEAAKFPWLNERFDRLDRNKDGILTRDELGLRPLPASSAQSPVARATPPGMKRAFTFTRDYTPGTKDANGKMGSGQELMRIVAYKGQLFASTSCASDPNLWMKEYVPDYPGCQVLRKADSKSEWQVDVSFGARYYRTDCLQVVRFTKDANGKALPQPVEMLVAGLWDDGELFPGIPHSNRNRTITLAVRDDTTGRWVFSYGPTVPDFDIERGFASVRATAVHIDKVTGREYLFVGAACGGMHKCVYDPASPGSLRWLEGDELDASYGRVHSFCVCNGDLYVSCDYGGLTVQNQGGGVYLRHDGEKPTWKNVYRNYDPGKPRANQTGRGITAVPAEDGSNREVMLGGIEQPPAPIIVRIEPHHNHQAVTELNYADYFKENVFGGRPGGKIGGGYLAAMNYFDTFIEPETGKKQYFVTIMMNHPDVPAEGCNGAYFLIRRGPGIYDWGEIDSGLPIGQSLQGSRTVVKSPFADEPDTYYFGGFASDGGRQRPPRSNLCWIYKGVVGGRVAGTTLVNPIPRMPVSTCSNTTYGFSFAYPKSLITKDNSKALFVATETNQAAPWIVANAVASGEVQNAVRQTFGTVFGSVNLLGYTETLIYLNGNRGYKGALKTGGIVGREYHFQYQAPSLGKVSVIGFGWVKGDNVITIALSYWGNYSAGMAKYVLNKTIASTTYDSSQPPTQSGGVSPQPRKSPPRSRSSQPAGDLPERFKQLDRNGGGKLTREEGPSATTLFERIQVAALTDQIVSTTTLAVADFNRDGCPDILLVERNPRNERGGRAPFRRLRLLLNQGNCRFTAHPLAIEGSALSAGDIGLGAAVLNLADFNRDGFLDIFLTRSDGSRGRGNTLLVSCGGYDRFRDVSAVMGIGNVGAYNRQSSLGDVNKDGWLDIAVAADNIGNTHAGFPRQRLYVFQPAGPRFEDGSFHDIGGTDAIPGFGGPYAADATKDKAGPQISLRDLDNDGDLDLIQSYHCDMLRAQWNDPKASGQCAFGVFVWLNRLSETGAVRFERVRDNGLAEEGRMRYRPELSRYEAVQRAVGHPYLCLADVDNNGWQDVISVGPTDLEWHVHSDQIAGRFWRGLGGGRFQEATTAAGLDALNWTYREWERFWEVRLPARSRVLDNVGRYSNQKPLLKGLTLADHQPYAADVVFGDFDNDGWVDFLHVNRHELGTEPGIVRNVLFMNNGDDTFRPTPTRFSGIDRNSIAAEAADLDSDGLLDLIFVNQPDMSGGQDAPDEAYMTKCYRNTGLHGARQNHWLHLTFSGVTDAELIGARVELTAGGKKQYRWIHSNHSYRTGGALDAHFGLGKQTKADVKVTLLSGKVMSFAGVKADQFLDLKLLTAQSTSVMVSGKP